MANQLTHYEGVYVAVDTLLKLRHIAKDLNLETRKKSVALMDGDSRTSFRGRGMEFSEVRRYQSGDDVRNIDWRVTARTQKPYTKLFQEERERPVYILVDQRSPMFFGSQQQFKSVFACKLAAVIAWTAMQHNDRIGALIFSDQQQTDSKPRRGKHAALSVIHQLCEYNHLLQTPFASATQQSLHEMLNDIRRVAKPGSNVYIISDCHDFDRNCQEPLSVLAKHCDVSVFQVFDELERSLPGQGFLTISDGASKLNLSGQSQQFVEKFTDTFDAHRFEIRKACNQAGVKFASLPAASAITDVSQDLFSSRRARKGVRA